ncbi:MAG: hypothetical protein AB7S75_23995 [Desulfococcaceae bacterium]
MAFVTITLQYLGDEYIVEIDDSLTPDELLEICKENLEIEGTFYLVPISSFGLTNGSRWEITQATPKTKVVLHK